MCAKIVQNATWVNKFNIGAAPAPPAPSTPPPPRAQPAPVPTPPKYSVVVTTNGTDMCEKLITTFLLQKAAPDSNTHYKKTITGLPVITTNDPDFVNYVARALQKCQGAMKITVSGYVLDGNEWKDELGGCQWTRPPRPRANGAFADATVQPRGRRRATARTARA